MVDKENSSGHIHLGGSRKFGDSLHGNSNLFKANQLSTPQHRLKSNIFHEMKSKTIQKSVNGTEKRRALGDLLNTSKANRQLAPSFGTPKIKADLSLKYGTPRNASINKFSNDFEKQTLSSKIKHDQADQENYPPVEKCIKQSDNFNDLFEDGKLSDIFLNKKVTYVPRLPSGGPKLAKDDDVYHELNVYSDKKWNKEMREVNRTFKKEQKKENLNFLETFQELPELPKLEAINDIVDDFEIDCDDSF